VDSESPIESGLSLGRQRLLDSVVWCACVLVACLFAGCRQSAARKGDQSAPAESSVVARVGDAVITREALQREWQGRGDTADKSAVLEEMIRFEAALAKARAAGYAHRPEITNRINQLIVEQFREDHLKGLEKTSQASSEEILDYYRGHANRFAVPEQLRAAVIFWKLSAKADEEARRELLKRAEAVAAEARHSDEAGFARLVQLNSEDQVTRYRGGDAGWLARGAENSPWDPEVLEALFAIKPGETTDVVATRRGLYLARLIELRAASIRPLDEVRNQIAYELDRQKHARGEQEYFDKLKAGLNIQINQSVLESIKPAQSSVGGQPPQLPKG
jgi:parvulin-like peptidyl-prolyl isomerase